jgi:hypothetical protein
MEIALSLANTTASVFGLARSLNVPTQTSPVLVQAENPGDPAGLSLCATAWSVAPSLPSLFLRRGSIPGVFGAGVAWTFPRGLILAPGSTLVVWNMQANGTVSAHFVVDE